MYLIAIIIVVIIILLFFILPKKAAQIIVLGGILGIVALCGASLVHKAISGGSGKYENNINNNILEHDWVTDTTNMTDDEAFNYAIKLSQQESKSEYIPETNVVRFNNNLYNKVSVMGDGSCFYHSLGYYLVDVLGWPVQGIKLPWSKLIWIPGTNYRTRMGNMRQVLLSFLYEKCIDINTNAYTTVSYYMLLNDIYIMKDFVNMLPRLPSTRFAETEEILLAALYFHLCIRIWDPRNGGNFGNYSPFIGTAVNDYNKCSSYSPHVYIYDSMYKNNEGFYVGGHFDPLVPQQNININNMPWKTNQWGKNGKHELLNIQTNDNRSPTEILQYALQDIKTVENKLNQLQNKPQQNKPQSTQQNKPQSTQQYKPQSTQQYKPQSTQQYKPQYKPQPNISETEDLELQQALHLIALDEQKQQQEQKDIEFAKQMQREEEQKDMDRLFAERLQKEM